MNFYAILGIPSHATEEAVRAAYKILARRYHPDAGAGSSPEKFRQVVEAYETLADPMRRRAYDRSLPSSPQSLSPTPVELDLTRRSHPFHYRVDSLFGDLIRVTGDDDFWDLFFRL